MLHWFRCDLVNIKNAGWFIILPFCSTDNPKSQKHDFITGYVNVFLCLISILSMNATGPRLSLLSSYFTRTSVLAHWMQVEPPCYPFFVLNVLSWQVLDLYFNPLVKKTKQGWAMQWSTVTCWCYLTVGGKDMRLSVFKACKQELWLCGSVCMTHVCVGKLCCSRRRGCPVCHLSHQSAQSSPPVQNSGSVWIWPAWFHEKAQLLDAALSSVKLWLSNQLASVHLENQKRPSLSEQCAKSTRLFLDRQIILYSCAHHRGNTSYRLDLIR